MALIKNIRTEFAPANVSTPVRIPARRATTKMVHSLLSKARIDEPLLKERFVARLYFSD
jgi:hypothetical protein